MILRLYHVNVDDPILVCNIIDLFLVIFFLFFVVMISQKLVAEIMAF
jgi:hypothetical protein